MRAVPPLERASARVPYRPTDARQTSNLNGACGSCAFAAWREKRAMADAYYRVQGVTPSHDSNRYLFTPTQRGMFK